MLRWGILGTGNIARQFAAAVASARKGRVVAVGSRSEESARIFAQEFGVGQAHGSYEALLRDDQVDAVYNALPNSLHRRWTIDALSAGKHVLCEKPLAMDVKEAREMFAAAKANDRVLMEAFMYRCHPMTTQVIERVSSGAIGELRIIRTSFCFRTRTTENNVRFVPALGGGALMDVGCYCINFARLFAGQGPTAAMATAKMHSSGVDETTAGSLTFSNGIVASFVCSFAAQADNTAYLCGSEGYIEIPIPWKPGRIARYIVRRGIPPKMDRAAMAPPIAGLAPGDFTVEAGGELYALEADEFASVIFDRQVPPITSEDSLGNMTVLDDLRKQIGLNWSL